MVEAGDTWIDKQSGEEVPILRVAEFFVSYESGGAKCSMLIDLFECDFEKLKGKGDA